VLDQYDTGVSFLKADSVNSPFNTLYTNTSTTGGQTTYDSGDCSD
jgi:hypothetical protein